MSKRLVHFTEYGLREQKRAKNLFIDTRYIPERETTERCESSLRHVSLKFFYKYRNILTSAM